MRKGYSENKEKPLSGVRALRGRLAPSCSPLGDRPHQSGRAAQALTGLRCTHCLCDRSSCGCWELSREETPHCSCHASPRGDPALSPGPAWPSLGAGKTGHPPLPVPPRLCRLLAQGCICSCPHAPLSHVPGRRASCCPAGRSDLLLLRGTRARYPPASEPGVPCEQEG